MSGEVALVQCILWYLHSYLWECPLYHFNKRGLLPVPHVCINHTKIWASSVTACQTSGPFLTLIRPTWLHKGGKQAEKPFICASDYTMKLQIGVVFLIPAMMHGAVNKSSGTVLQMNPDAWKQFTKGLILQEKLGQFTGLIC